MTNVLGQVFHNSTQILQHNIKLVEHCFHPTHTSIGEPHRLRAGSKIGSGPQVGKLATSPLPYRGAPPLQSGGQNQKWPTSGQIGYLTPAVSGSPTASERGAKSESGGGGRHGPRSAGGKRPLGAVLKGCP